DKPRGAAEQRLPRFAVPDRVAIPAPPRPAPWIEIQRHFANVANRYVVRQVSVERSPDGCGVVPRFRGERRHLANGMDAGVRTSCQVDAEARSEERCRRAFQITLDGATVRLLLGTDELRPVVANGSRESLRGHRSGSASPLPSSPSP